MKNLFTFLAFYIPVALVLVFTTPVSSGGFGLFDREIITLFSIGVGSLLVGLILIREWIRNKKNVVETEVAVSGKRKISWHFIISLLLSPFGGFVILFSDGGLPVDEFVESWIGPVICFDSISCKDVVGDLSIWPIGIFASMVIVYVLPRILVKHFANRSE